MEVQAPLLGKVIKVEVAAGATVEEDDELIVIEAMKMECPIYAPCAGTVTGIQVKEGDTVQENQVLATIE